MRKHLPAAALWAIAILAATLPVTLLVAAPAIPARKAAEPALVIVLDSTGKRITNPEFEAIAASLPAGKFTVALIPAPGEVGSKRVITIAEEATPDVPVVVVPDPVIPDPIVPPAPVGTRQLYIIRETNSTTPAEAQLVTLLRTGANAKYLIDNKHTLNVLDKDLPEATKHKYADKLPALLIYGDGKLLSAEALPATAAEVIAKLKAVGG